MAQSEQNSQSEIKEMDDMECMHFGLREHVPLDLLNLYQLFRDQPPLSYDKKLAAPAVLDVNEMVDIHQWFRDQVSPAVASASNNESVAAVIENASQSIQQNTL